MTSIPEPTKTVNDYFHLCWAQAKASPEYKKEEWLILQRMLEKWVRV